MSDDVALYAAKYGVPTAVALLAVAVRMLFSADRWTLLGIVRDVLVGLLVGHLAAMWVWDAPGLSQGEKGSVVAVCAILAADIVVALLSLGRKFREDPLALLELIRGWRKP